MFSRAKTPFKDELSTNPSVKASIHSRDIKRVGTASQSSEKDNALRSYHYPASPDIRSPSLLNQKSSNWGQKPHASKPTPMKVYSDLKQSKFGCLQGIQEEEQKNLAMRPPSRRRSPTNLAQLDEINEYNNTASRPRTTQNLRNPEIPLIVTKEDSKKRRIYSAYKGNSKTKILPDRKDTFDTVLDHEFISLFN